MLTLCTGFTFDKFNLKKQFGENSFLKTKMTNRQGCFD